MLPKPSMTIPKYIADGFGGWPRDRTQVPNVVFSAKSLVLVGLERSASGTFLKYKHANSHYAAAHRMFPSVMIHLLLNTDIDLRSPDIKLTFGKHGYGYALTIAQ